MEPKRTNGPEKKGKSIHTSRVRRRRRRRKDGTEITTDYYPRKNNIKTQSREEKKNQRDAIKFVFEELYLLYAQTEKNKDRGSPRAH